MPAPLRDRLLAAIDADDRLSIDAMLAEPGALAALNEPSQWAPPALARAATVDTAQYLIDKGADLDIVGGWWAPGFNVAKIDANVGRFLIDAGAPATPHAASGVGHVDMLTKLIDDDASVVHAKGGDGCTPLHFARDVATAALLLEHGAEIDARDDDHGSTPLHWLAGGDEALVRFLLEHGAMPDVFIAAALGDRDLVDRLVDDNAARLAYRVGLAPQFPPIGHEDTGGTIYQWTLGFNSFAHQYALARGHADLYAHMLERSDTKTRFLVACVTADRPRAEAIVAAHPDIIETLTDDDLVLLPQYCWETNVDIDAVRLMLDLGWPIDITEQAHGYSGLHNAAFGGYADVVDLLIERGSRMIGVEDPNYGSTPLGFALHCCLADGRHPEGEYVRVVESLLKAGDPLHPDMYPTTRDDLNDVMKPYAPRRETPSAG